MKSLIAVFILCVSAVAVSISAFNRPNTSLLLALMATSSIAGALRRPVQRDLLVRFAQLTLSLDLLRLWEIVPFRSNWFYGWIFSLSSIFTLVVLMFVNLCALPLKTDVLNGLNRIIRSSRAEIKRDYSLGVVEIIVFEPMVELFLPLGILSFFIFLAGVHHNYSREIVNTTAPLAIAIFFPIGHLTATILSIHRRNEHPLRLGVNDLNHRGLKMDFLIGVIVVAIYLFGFWLEGRSNGRHFLWSIIMGVLALAYFDLSRLARLTSHDLSSNQSFVATVAPSKLFAVLLQVAIRLSLLCFYTYLLVSALGW